MDYLSTEHHVDLYSLATVLKTHGQEDATREIGTTVLANIKLYMDAVFDGEKYFVGTGPCGTDKPSTPDGGVYNVIVNQETGGIPVDCQTWTTLAGIGTREQQRTSMAWAVKNCFIRDSDHQSASRADYANYSVPEEGPLSGVRFTNRGKGIQLENTGSGLMALLRHRPDHVAIPLIVRTIDTLMKSAPDGMYASLWPVEIIPAYGEGVHNTGLSWSYSRTPHLASTIYCMLARMYQTAKSPERYNPYSTYIESYERPSQTTAVFEDHDFGRPFTKRDVDVNSLLPKGTILGFFYSQPLWWKSSLVISSVLPNKSVGSFFRCSSLSDVLSIGSNKRFLNQTEDIQTEVLNELFELIKKSA
jgi:hypothetical protein